MQIIYEDKEILVYHKPSGLATQTSKLGEKDVVSELKNYVKGSYIGLIHRLDQPVEGLLVFAKNTESAKELSKQLVSHEMNKIYLACVAGNHVEEKDTRIDYLLKDGKSNTSKIVNSNVKGAKRAELSYGLIQQKEKVAIIKVNLKTGRHHQIRVQMAHAGFPLLGDYKYGSEESMMIGREFGIREIGLCACELSFLHPKTKKQCLFQIEPKGQWFHAI